ERQPARFAAQRSATDPQEKTSGGSQRRRVEVSDQQFVLLGAIPGNRRNQIPPQVFDARVMRHLPRPQPLRQNKLCPSRQPTRKMVALCVVRNAFRGNFLEQAFERAEVSRAPNFRQVRRAENEVSKPELFAQKPSQLGQQGRRAFAQERETFVVSALAELLAARLQHDRNVRYGFANQASQFKSCLAAQFTLARKFNIGDHTHQVRKVLFYQFFRRLVTGRQQDLRTRAHPKQFVPGIDAFTN